MFFIEETGKEIEASVALGSRPMKSEGEGFSFYGDGQYITSQRGDNPVLIAVNEEQLKGWKHKKLTAIPCMFWEPCTVRKRGLPL